MLKIFSFLHRILCALVSLIFLLVPYLYYWDTGVGVERAPYAKLPQNVEWIFYCIGLFYGFCALKHDKLGVHFFKLLRVCHFTLGFFFLISQSIGLKDNTLEAIILVTITALPFFILAYFTFYFISSRQPS